MCWIDYDPVDNSIATNSTYALQLFTQQIVLCDLSKSRGLARRLT